MWATGTGVDVMKRLAAPMVGGVLSAIPLTLMVIPALYITWIWQSEVTYLQTGKDCGALQVVVSSSA